MKNLNRFVLTRVALAIAIAVLVVLSKKEMIWGGFKVLIFPKPVFRAWVVFMILLLLSAVWKVLLEMYRRGMMPRIQAFVRRSIEPVYEKTLAFLHRASSRLSFQLLLWGLVMGIIIIVFWKSDSLRDSRLNEIRQLPVPGHTVGSAESDAVVLGLGSMNNNQDLFLQNCLKVVNDLKAVGVKAVLIPFDHAWSTTAVEFVRQLNETGVVVFGNQTGTDFQFGDPKTGKMYEYRAGYFTAWGEDYPWYSFIRRIEPIAKKMPFSLRKDPAYDVSFEMLRLYYGISEEEQPLVIGNEIVFGDLRYPIDENGGLYAGKLVNRNLFPHTAAFYDPNRKELIYLYYESYGGRKEIPSFEPVRNTFSGKMVVLDWWYGNYGDRGRSQAYAQVLANLASGHALWQSRWGTLLMALFSIALCGVILRKSTPLSAVAFILIVFWMIALLSAWLFQIQSVIVDAAYSFVAIALSIVVFSVVRLAHEWRFGSSSNVTSSLRTSMSTMAPATGASFALFRRRVTMSPAVAFAIILFVVVTTAAVVTEVITSKSDRPAEKIVYVTSLPTVEVQGFSTVEKSVKQ